MRTCPTSPQPKTVSSIDCRPSAVCGYAIGPSLHFYGFGRGRVESTVSSMKVNDPRFVSRTITHHSSVVSSWITGLKFRCLGNCEMLRSQKILLYCCDGHLRATSYSSSTTISSTQHSILAQIYAVWTRAAGFLLNSPIRRLSPLSRIPPVPCTCRLNSGARFSRMFTQAPCPTSL
jgi:hypothetical protein